MNLKGIEDEYAFQTRLGSGAFAQVFRAVQKSTGNIVAVKMIDPPPPQNESFIYMIMECCEGGDFSKYIRKHKRLTEEKAKYFMRQLANGLKFLRMRDIIHRDLKPQNLLLSDSGDSPTLKIADFGFARFIDVQSLSDTFCGSPLYMAPEILNRKNYTVKADLWSVGVILYEMLVGEPPLNCNTVVDLLHQLEKNTINIPSHIQQTISKECQDLLHSLLQTNEMNRLSWEDFFQHPWLGFSQSIPQFIYQQQKQQYQQQPYQQQPHPHSAPTTNPIVSLSPVDNNVYYPSHYQQQQQQPPFQQKGYPLQQQQQKMGGGNNYNNRDRSLNRSKSFTENNNYVYNIIQQQSNQQQPLAPPSSNTLLKIKQSSTSSLDFEKSCVIMDDEEYINALDTTSKRALAIAELGDLRQIEPNECIILYTKALVLIKSKLQTNSSNNHCFGSSNLYKFNSVMDRIADIYNEYYGKLLRFNEIYNAKSPSTIATTTTAASSALSTSSNNSGIQNTNNNNNNPTTTNTSIHAQLLEQSSSLSSTGSNFSPNKYIYETALDMGKNGGLEEMYRDYQKALQYYNDGLILLDYLLSIAIDSEDKDVLMKYITSFKIRIDKVVERTNSNSNNSGTTTTTTTMQHPTFSNYNNNSSPVPITF
ncbi:autophagy protein 1 [Cavenderia fasciculata]|uniref:Autophagy protein 1 n=1 Tax=Cavenderia fasciculata TaxID=261658 RepID=F4PI77_CACFS|nr:autophagy protein 1 [Cavenderia fasciculata]EGG25360.1 autophagy protein 1 [Cavenderia fasciculata]|eukprot:XP_004363211.1 autophagy protein 1 [Cavenderia fasciculata]